MVLRSTRVGVDTSPSVAGRDPNPVKLLLVEDDARTAQAIARGLREEGYVVDISTSAEDAEALATGGDHRLLIVDWYLPAKDGLAMCRDLRRQGVMVPILMLTARDALADRVAALDTGVDDYVTKPFAFAELLARLRALLRRSDLSRPVVLSVEDLCIDPVRHRVTRNGVAVPLTLKEYQILEVLMRHPGEVVLRSQIEQELWGEVSEVTSNALDAHVSHLRRKVDPPGTKRLLHTARGRGFYLGSGAD
jgi:DNA-binding response OmpR family regulator